MQSSCRATGRSWPLLASRLGESGVSSVRSQAVLNLYPKQVSHPSALLSIIVVVSTVLVVVVVSHKKLGAVCGTKRQG